jgi:hypothetical protein
METSDKITAFHETLTDWDEFRKWCEDRRGAMLVAKDLPLFVQLFRENQDRLRHQELLRALESAAPASVDGKLIPGIRARLQNPTASEHADRSASGES